MCDLDSIWFGEGSIHDRCEMDLKVLSTIYLCLLYEVYLEVAKEESQRQQLAYSLGWSFCV